MVRAAAVLALVASCASEPIVRTGSCLQLKHRYRDHALLYKNGQQLGSTDDASESAFADGPATAVARMRRAHRLGRLTVVLAVVGAAVVVATAIVAGFKNDARLVLPGVGVLALESTATWAVGTAADGSQDEAFAEYNVWAATHGCR